MINPNQISVVVQGLTDKKETKKCLNSIRKYLSGAEIILSTWEGADVSSLDFDTVIFNKDPGSVIFTTDGVNVHNNLNRQLLSTQAGIKKATRPYILKLRSDLILSHNGFLDYFDKYQARCDKYKLFERKILVSTLYTRKFVIKHETKETCFTPFHISDWFFFGLAEDIKKYFLDTPLVKEPEYSTYFNNHPEKADKRYHTVSCYQYPPEQYLMFSCVKRNFPEIEMDDLTDVTPENILQSEIAVVNNFIVLEYKQHGIYLNKYRVSKKEKRAGFYDAYGLYFNSVYEKDYQKHCDAGFELSKLDAFCSESELEPLIFKLYDHINKIFEAKIPFLKKISEIFSVISYGMKICRKVCRNFKSLFKNETNFDYKKKLLFDANVLANGAFQTTARSGVYFVAYNILLEMLRRTELDVTLFYNTKSAHFVETVLDNDDCLKNVKRLKFSPLDKIISRLEFAKYNNKQNKENLFQRLWIKFRLNCFGLIKNLMNLFGLDKHYVKKLKDINVFFSPWGIVPDFVQKNKHIKNYIFVHDVIPLLFPENFPDIKKKNSDFYKLFHSFDEKNHYFVNSEHTKQDLIKFTKLKDENITLALLSTGNKYEKVEDEARIIRVKEKYNIPQDKKYLFSLCSLEPRKNLIFAVKNFVEFIKRNNIDDFVFVLGGGHWDIFVSKLNETISNLEEFKDKIIKIGYVSDEDLPSLYSGAQMFVFPSLYEGFGMPILESMKSGCPVICSNTSSMPEVIGDCGIQINPNNDEELIKAFEKMYFDNEFREKCMDKGLQRAKLFKWEKCVDVIIKKLV